MSESGTGRPVVYFHVGAPKTGTTFLQRVLWQNRDTLRAAGVLYPGDTFGAHVHAAFDLRKSGFQGYQDPRTTGAWDSMVTQARDWNGPVIISQELFSPATPAQVDTALADLGFAEVHLLYTARELSRQIPAAWQEDLKNRFTPTFDEFVTALRHPDQDKQGLGRMFWRMQDAPEVLARWTRNLPPTHVHVITVPKKTLQSDERGTSDERSAPDHRADPPDLLWRRFAAVVGIDPDQFDTSRAFTNTSLGAAEATFLRRLNLALDAEVGWPLYDQMVKHLVAQDVLARREGSQQCELQPDDAAWAQDRTDTMVDGLVAAGYDIVGTLDDLQTGPAKTGPPPPSEPGSDEGLDMGVEVAAALIHRMSELRDRLEAAEALVRSLAVPATSGLAAAREHRSVSTR